MADSMLPWLIVVVLLVVLYMRKKDDEKYYMRSVMCEGNKCRLTKARDVPWQKGEPMPAF